MRESKFGMKLELFGPCADALNGDEPPSFHGQCHGQFRSPEGGIALRCNCVCHDWDDEEGNDD